MIFLSADKFGPKVLVSLGYTPTSLLLPKNKLIELCAHRAVDWPRSKQAITTVGAKAELNPLRI